eukprot:CAMPEP_0175134646 /NCGR_PEP_ID=MMETSP0087-20121206/8290_1 /TAXON_ID=136419 /ORGANISM="Unknown Unknown, Strain D1" /LENGTH=765 /DNA_ID=CAMNT_0016417223 /DNA_START=1087 /DNA_END=3384 /DNA_ORIENTATION=-
MVLYLQFVLLGSFALHILKFPYLDGRYSKDRVNSKLMDWANFLEAAVLAGICFLLQIILLSERRPELSSDLQGVSQSFSAVFICGLWLLVLVMVVRDRFPLLSRACALAKPKKIVEAEGISKVGSLFDVDQVCRGQRNGREPRHKYMFSQTLTNTQQSTSLRPGKAALLNAIQQKLARFGAAEGWGEPSYSLPGSDMPSETMTGSDFFNGTGRSTGTTSLYEGSRRQVVGALGSSIRGSKTIQSATMQTISKPSRLFVSGIRSGSAGKIQFDSLASRTCTANGSGATRNTGQSWNQKIFLQPENNEASIDQVDLEFDGSKMGFVSRSPSTCVRRILDSTVVSMVNSEVNTANASRDVSKSSSCNSSETGNADRVQVIHSIMNPDKFEGWVNSFISEVKSQQNSQHNSPDLSPCHSPTHRRQQLFGFDAPDAEDEVHNSVMMISSCVENEVQQIKRNLRSVPGSPTSQTSSKANTFDQLSLSLNQLNRLEHLSRGDRRNIRARRLRLAEQNGLLGKCFQNSECDWSETSSCSVFGSDSQHPVVDNEIWFSEAEDGEYGGVQGVASPMSQDHTNNNTDVESVSDVDMTALAVAEDLIGSEKAQMGIVVVPVHLNSRSLQPDGDEGDLAESRAPSVTRRAADSRPPSVTRKEESFARPSCVQFDSPELSRVSYFSGDLRASPGTSAVKVEGCDASELSLNLSSTQTSRQSLSVGFADFASFQLGMPRHFQDVDENASQSDPLADTFDENRHDTNIVQLQDLPYLRDVI